MKWMERNEGGEVVRRRMERKEGLQLLITSLVSFSHCVVCPSLIYSFSLPLWYLLAIVLYVLL
jgi:hypothetical protein